MYKRKYDDQAAPPPATQRPTGFSAPIAPYSPNSAPPSYGVTPKMSDEQYSSGADTAAAPSPATRRPTGFSAPIAPHSPDSAPPSYNAVASSGFSSIPPDVKPHTMSSSKKINIPNARVGLIIGKCGETIKDLQTQSEAKIQITSAMGADPKSDSRAVKLMGTPEQIAKAEQLITDLISKTVSERSTARSKCHDSELKIPNNKVGLVIGKAGETIRTMEDYSGGHIQVIPLAPGDTSPESTLLIKGTYAQIRTIEQWINEIINTGTSSLFQFTQKKRVKNPSKAGRYSQQGYQAWLPTDSGTWLPPFEQPGYGYAQKYPDPSPQYNMSQPPPYSGYPPLANPLVYGQPTQSLGGTPGGYGQPAPVQPGYPHSQPPAASYAQGGGNDYYSQQPPSQQQQTPGGPAAPADNSGYGYGYGQQQPSSYNQQGQQGYTQDGYGGYQAQPQSGYGQPPSYDQQQGYAFAPTYGNVTNPTQDGHAPSYGSHGYGGYQAQPQSGYGQPPSYDQQQGYASAQLGYEPGYGAPQAQKPLANPPVYGQPTQSLGGTLEGYGQPAPVQPGYAAPPHGAPPEIPQNNKQQFPQQ